MSLFLPDRRGASKCHSLSMKGLSVGLRVRIFLGPGTISSGWYNPRIMAVIVYLELHSKEAGAWNRACICLVRDTLFDPLFLGTQRTLPCKFTEVMISSSSWAIAQCGNKYPTEVPNACFDRPGCWREQTWLVGAFLQKRDLFQLLILEIIYQYDHCSQQLRV